jgi:hypothetical protein
MMTARYLVIGRDSDFDLVKFERQWQTLVRPVSSVNPARGECIQNEANAAAVANHGRLICPVDLATQQTI